MKESRADDIGSSCQLRMVGRIELDDESPPCGIDYGETRCDAFGLRCHHCPFCRAAGGLTGGPLFNLRGAKPLSIMPIDVPFAVRYFTQCVYSTGGYGWSLYGLVFAGLCELRIEKI